MAVVLASQITGGPNISKISSTMSASNTTASNVLFTLTGSVHVVKLYGIVTTALGSNHTAAHWRMNDQTNTPAVTLAAGTTLSSAGVGAMISKLGLAGAALILSDSTQVRINEPTALETLEFEEFSLTAKNGVVNTLDYRYTTTQTPTTGVVQFFAHWYPLSDDGRLV